MNLEGFESFTGVVVVAEVLRSGLVIAGGYADKVRRVLFAQLKDKIKQGEIEAREVARAAGELNRLLFEILVNKLGIDKGDVVRITVEYDVEGGQIKWHLDTLTIQAWRRIPDEQISEAIKDITSKAEEILLETPRYNVVKLGETDTGDLVYKLTLGDEDAGAILVTPVNDKAVVRAAFLVPSPKILKRHIIDVKGGIDETIERSLEGLLREAEDAERRHAERVYREILALIEVAEEGEEEENV